MNPERIKNEGRTKEYYSFSERRAKEERRKIGV
jgi:hypothetical protein